MPEIAEQRPPYVEFKFRSVEDRNASLAAGHYVARDVAYAFITPAGSKDRTEKIAEEWLKHLDMEVKQQRFPAEWLKHYKAAYEAWKEDRELPPTGTALSSWPPLSPAQLENLLQLRIRTVEDLASANEEAIMRMGMGGRALKSLAEEWLRTSKGIGQTTATISELRRENAELKAQHETAQEQLRNLSAQVQLLMQNRPAGQEVTHTPDADEADLGFDLKVAAPAQGGARKL